MLVRALFAGLLILLLTGCGTTQLAPVAERSQRPHKGAAPSHYRVRKGDTLYSITWRYGLNVRQVARLNNIDNKYRIYPGQRLRLRSLATSTPGRSKNIQKKTASQTPKTRVKNKSTAASGRTSTLKSRTPAVGNQTATQATKSVKTVAKADSPKLSSTSGKKNSAIVGKVRWQWPASGKVIERFSTRGRINKGINIAGRLGDRVSAAAGGEVVYVGNGLLGYGNLIIINHNGLYMSAYAHNSRVFVKERDRVSRGDRIAEVGSSGTDRHKLHFEIRRDGKPVNPMKYLPRR